MSAEPTSRGIETTADAPEPRRRRRSISLVELLSNGLSATQQHGLAPFTLAFVILAPAALMAIAIESWIDLPGSLLLVGLLMASFSVYLAAVTPLLVNDEAAARQRSLSAAIDHADASIPGLMLASAATGVLVAAGLELRLLPGFLILGLLALTAPAGLREKRGPISSLRRGLSLTQGNAPAFAVLGALIGAAALGVYAVLAFVLEPLPGFLGELVAVSTATTLTAPLAAHTFVRAFDGRAAGRRLAVRPPQGTDIAGAGAHGRSAIQRTLGSLGDSRTAPKQRVSFTSRADAGFSALRYSPKAATQTARLPRPYESHTTAPDWASVDDATVEELHSAV